MIEMDRKIAWDIYFGGIMSINYHPGTTKENAKRLSIEECAQIADAMLKERDKRFKE